MRGFLLFLLGFLVMPVVPFFAIRGKYPDWMVTPDDPVSPFGQYEATVKKVYEKYGRFVGDVYWLAFRNRMFGLAYKWKPAFLKGVVDYNTLRTHRQRLDYKYFSVQKTTLLAEKLYHEHIFQLGPVYLITGWKISPLHDDKHIIRNPVNMDGRPTFSFRSRKTV